MDRSGFTSLSRSLSPSEIWDRVYRTLDAAELASSPGAPRRTIANFSWTPGRRYSGGLRDLNLRLINDWAHPELQPEGWAFGILPNRPGREGDRAIVQIPVGAEYSYALDVPASAVAVVGTTGPYLAFALASANRDGDQRFAKPVFHRLLLQAIAGPLCPVPVESGYEREVVAVLQRRRLPFDKPMLSDQDGLRPDFILPTHRIVIEVQGMNTDDYRARKTTVHAQIRESSRFRGWTFLTYDPNDGEKIEDFTARLPYG